MNEHYVCTECKGVSDKEGLCQTEGCGRAGLDLVVCRCEDGEHASVGSEESSSENSES